MPTITFILGLSGAGKTTRAEALRRENPMVEIVDEGAFVLPDRTEAVFKALEEGRDVVAIEIQLGLAAIRGNACDAIAQRVPNTVVKWVAFKNDLEKCNANCRRRPDRDPVGHIGMNGQWTKDYTIPEDAVILEVYSEPVESPPS